MEAKKPTLEDVGRLAGVSRATASRVITSSRNVSGPSADRVRRAVELLGYEPDLAARALAKGRSSVVDLIVIDEDSSAFGTNPYYSRVVAGILEALSETEAQMRLHIVAEEDAAETIDHVARTARITTRAPAAASAASARPSRRRGCRCSRWRATSAGTRGSPPPGGCWPPTRTST